jgi:hypothetical protein
MKHDDAFYVGYQPRAAASVGRFLRWRVGLLLGIVAGLAVGYAAFLPAERGGRFENGIERNWEGRLLAAPYPMLAVPRAEGGWRFMLLVGRGKHGAAAEVAGFDDAAVRLTGMLIERDGSTMIEVTARPTRLDERALPPLLAAADLGEVELAGEIVDGKCHLGVMVPGEGRTHRGCAIRCISGGAPPLLVARDSTGRSLRLLLTDAAGGPVGDRVLDLVAQPVTIRGTMSRRGDLLYLAADPSSYGLLK